MKSEWKTVRLGDVCEKIGSGATPRGGKESYQEEGIALIRSQNVLDFCFSIEGLARISDAQASQLNNVTVESRDVLLNITGDSVARACLVPDNMLPARVNQHVAIVRSNGEKADKRYILYFLQSIKPHLLQIASAGATRNALTKGMIEALEINLPPLPIQQTIANTLSALDEKIANNNAINNHLEQMAQAIFKSWFVDFEPWGGEMPEDWRKVSLGDLCLIVTKGTTPTTLKKQFVVHGINFVKAESILNDHSLDFSKLAFIDDETNTLLNRSVIRENDIIFTIAGTLGRFAFVESDLLPANTNQAVAIIRADTTKINPVTLYSFFIGGLHSDFYTKNIQQAVQANLSLTTIKALPLFLPPVETFFEYSALITPLFEQTFRNYSENRRLATIRDTLLPRLMSGELSIAT